MRFRHLASALLLGSIMQPAMVGAQSINLGTGLSAGGVALADGATDPFWTTSVNGGATFSAAKVLGNSFNTPCGCSILPNALSGKWINTTGQIGTGWPIGQTVYTRRSFDLSGYDLTSVLLSGSFAVMDSNLGLYLNGTLLPGTTLLYPSYTPWSFLTNFSVLGTSGLFNAGVNTLEFRSTSVNSIYDGVMLQKASVDGDYTPPATVPEPASLALMATGLVGVAVVGRRRRR